MEVRLLAARRMGELVPPEKPGRGKKISRTSANFPDHQRLSEFRKLAEIPIAEFKDKIESLKEREEKLTERQEGGYAIRQWQNSTRTEKGNDGRMPRRWIRCEKGHDESGRREDRPFPRHRYVTDFAKTR